jgi:hypothetical protein
MGGCDATPPPAATPTGEIVVLPTSSTDALSPVFEDELAAPVVYLGRAERPFRARRLSAGSAGLLRTVSTAIVLVSPGGDAASANAWWSDRRPVGVDSLQISTPGGKIHWAVYEDVFRVPQTLVRVRGAVDLDETMARRLAMRLRHWIEVSQVHHRAAQMQRAPGATMLSGRATDGAFRVLLPTGYAWSDTSSGWPQSVQLFTTHPTRIVAVFWLEDAQPEWVQSHVFLIGFLRDAIWRLHQDRLAEDSIDWLHGTDNQPTVRAVWQNPQAIAGGPMQVRFVYDARRRRLYGVQAMIFLPGTDKYEAMREVVAVASTFELQE